MNENKKSPWSLLVDKLSFPTLIIAALFALILVTKAISKEDLALIPKGDKIARILRVE